MPAQTIHNGSLPDFDLEIETGPNGEVQVTTEKQLESTVGSAGASDFAFTVSTSTKQFTNVPSDATRALLSVEAPSSTPDGIRWTDNGRTGVGSEGHLLLAPGDDVVYFYILGRTRILNWRMIRAGSSDIDCKVSYYK
jgi:hypothetical protein